jgi:hypothetical protein
VLALDLDDGRLKTRCRADFSSATKVQGVTDPGGLSGGWLVRQLGGWRGGRWGSSRGKTGGDSDC